MVGITSYGAYIPYWRLDEGAISPKARGEKPICNFDEDSLTMGVAAALDCLRGVDRDNLDALYFASTTPPYSEKSSASTIAMAADLPRDIATADFGGSLRSGACALRAALDAVEAKTAGNILVASADMRMGAPSSPQERSFADGAGALLIGSNDVIATVEARYSVSDDILDQWRPQGEKFIRAWEDRFSFSQGYQPLVSEAVSVLLMKSGLTPKDIARAVFCSPDGKKHLKVAAKLGFDLESQVVSPRLDQMGNTGSALSIMGLVAALEQSKPGDLILLASYGDGCDAFLVKVQDPIEKITGRRGITGHLSSKKIINDYRTYLFWRGLLPTGRRVDTVSFVSAPAIHRAQDSNLRLLGCKCQSCGTVQFPMQRVCTKCHGKDHFVPYRLSDKRAEVFTFTGDYISNPLLESPIVTNTIDFVGGGRMQCFMTDCEFERIHPGMPVEMAFRKINFRDGIHCYAWKSIPLRD